MDTFVEMGGTCKYLWKRIKTQHMTENLSGTTFCVGLIGMTSLQQET